MLPFFQIFCHMIITIVLPTSFPGLYLVLYVQQDEYIHPLTPAAGVRMVVHDQNEMPFPEDDGISIAPGLETSVALKKVRNNG